MTQCSRNYVSVVAYGLFLLACLFYGSGVAPSIAWRDSSEFVTVVQTLGISHPSGSPTYNLLAKPLSFLPIGSIALRINLFSALCGAFLVSLIFLLLYELLATVPTAPRMFAAVGGAGFLLLSESLWRFAEVAEVYTLQNVLLILLVLCLLKMRSPELALPQAQKWGWLFAFVYGLSAGVHGTMAFFAPAFLLFLVCTAPRLLRGKTLAFGTFFFLLGFATFLYLPLRSLSNPAFDWGDPQTWQQFFAHITDRKDSAGHYVFPWEKMPYQIGTYLYNLHNEFFALGLALGVIGCIANFRRDKALSLLFWLIFLGNVGFFVRSWTAAFGFIPSFVIFAIWIGFGIAACLTALHNLYQGQVIRVPRSAFTTLLYGGIVVSLGHLYWGHVTIADQRQNYSAELYGKALLAHMPLEAIFFSHYSWFPLLYLQHVEQQRPDVTVLLQGEIFTPQYYPLLSQQRFPHLRLSADSAPHKMTSEEYFWYLAKINTSEHALLWDPEGDYAATIDPYLVPKGLLYAFDPHQKTVLTAADVRRHQHVLTETTARILTESRDYEATLLLASKWYFFGRYLQQRGFDTAAAHSYAGGIHLKPEDAHLRNAYGKWLLQQGKVPQAFEHFQAAAEANPFSSVATRNIGLVLLMSGQYADAAQYLERTLGLEEPDGDLQALLGETYARLQQFPKAQQALHEAVRLYEEKQVAPAEQTLLQHKLTWARENLRRLQHGMTHGLVPLTDVGPTRH